MNKEQQIKEMAKIAFVAESQNNATGGIRSDYTIFSSEQILKYGCGRLNAMIALYNAGYRKTFTSEFTSEMQQVYKEGYEKGCEACAQSWENGYNDGFEDGKEQVEKDSYERGFADGNAYLRNELRESKAEAVKEFAEKLKEYARACKSSGYDGIGENDIDEKLKEYKNGIHKTKT